MKKIIAFIASIIMLFSCNSGIVYDVTITGDADGQFELTIPDGKLNLDGTAGLNFDYGNDTIPVNEFYTMEQLYFGEVRGATKAIDELEPFIEEFNATALSGTYYVRIKGFAKEPKTGITIEIDKTLTNRDVKEGL